MSLEFSWSEFLMGLLVGLVATGGLSFGMWILMSVSLADSDPQKEPLDSAQKAFRYLLGATALLGQLLLAAGLLYRASQGELKPLPLIVGILTGIFLISLGLLPFLSRKK